MDFEYLNYVAAFEAAPAAPEVKIVEEAPVVEVVKEEIPVVKKSSKKKSND